jgi:hypothetical protein
MNTSVDHPSRTVTVGSHTFRLSPKGSSAWDVFEGDQHFGWFAIGEKRDRTWLLVNHEAYYKLPMSPLINALAVGRLWVNSFDHNGDPRP